MEDTQQADPIDRLDWLYNILGQVSAPREAHQQIDQNVAELRQWIQDHKNGEAEAE